MSAAADVRPALMEHLKDLHLPTVRECYEDTARRAERETLSYEQYLLEVISRECEQRRKSKVQRLLKEERERFSFRESWIREEPSTDSTGPGVGSDAGAQDAFHQVRPPDAGFTGRQAGPAAEP